MKPRKKNQQSPSRVDQYFVCIRDRQKLQEQYYHTGDPALLPEIDQARERIREVIRGMG